MTTAEVRAPKVDSNVVRSQLGAALIGELYVVVPAHNEETLLAECLRSLHCARRQLWLQFPHIVCRIVVVADDCIDRTADIAAAMDATVLDVEYRNVGAARRAGADNALGQSTSPLDRLWLASTDADSQVPEGWLAHFAAAAASGYHLVAGMVCPTAELAAGQRQAWQVRHPNVDGHPHVHGANLGVRADVYRRLGGWSPLRTGEDVELVTRAERHPGVQILRSGRLPVLTSARLTGRAPAGFADYLTTLNGPGVGRHQSW